MKLSGILGHEVPEVWAQVLPYVKRGCDVFNDHTITEIMKDCISRRSQLWVLYEGEKIFGVLVTAIYGELCNMELFSGDGIDRMLPHLQTLEKWAKDGGCKRIEVTGRKGWIKKMKDYNVKKITLVKEI